MIAVDAVAKGLTGLGFDRVATHHGATYRDCSTVIVTPTRGMIHHRWVAATSQLIKPMNQKCGGPLFAVGDEVGQAYDKTIAGILAHPELSTWRYLLTIEDDNLVPPDALVRLLESIESHGGFDAVGGLYFTKGDVNMPMAYGCPEEYARTRKLDFRPRSVAEAVKAGAIMPVNGIAMGCSLYRMSLFRELPPPWFVTVADVVPGVGAQGFTQDLWFSRRAVEAGKRMAIDCRVKVAHLDVTTGIVY